MQQMEDASYSGNANGNDKNDKQEQPAVVNAAGAIRLQRRLLSAAIPARQPRHRQLRLVEDGSGAARIIAACEGIDADLADLL